MNRIEARLLVDCQCELGEGVQWNDTYQRLFWTDIHGRKFMSCSAGGDDFQSIQLSERLTAFCFDTQQRVLAAFESGLFVCSEWQQLAVQRTCISTFEPENVSTRYNDGRCDRHGRFLVGGMDEDGLQPTSTLTQFDGNEVQTLLSGIGCSNAICFSIDGDRLYFADTSVGEIWAFDYDSGRSEIKNRRLFVAADAAEGFPDGACIDSQGSLWNARFNGFSVVGFDQNGEPISIVQLPVPQVTCACFGGPDLDRLYITTARENFSATDAERYPQSGGLFVAEVGATGLLESRCGDLGQLLPDL